jgi:RNA polymerase sigma factor (TIGR02999 family)
MSEDKAHDVSRILTRMNGGDPSAPSELFPLLYEEMRRLAASYFSAGQVGLTLQPTALVHEVYMRLAGAEQDFRGREHFMAVAATAMRQVLADHARARRAEKRGGNAQRVTLDENVGGSAGKDDVDLVALDDALTKLESVNPRAARVAELRMLSGLSSSEAAHALGVTERTVQLDWRAASAWLERELGEPR